MKSMLKCHYLRSVDRRWRAELQRAKGRVSVLSPYLTSRTAEMIIGNVQPDRCEVYTLFSVENFAAGASSVRTLRVLSEAGYALYELPRLHAKIVLVSGQFVSIGSQNVTQRGIRNREATSVFTAPEEVALVEKLLAPWLLERSAITIEMIGDLERLLPPIRRMFNTAQKSALDLGKDLSLLQAAREKRRKEEQAGQEAQSKERARKIAIVRAATSRFEDKGNVPRELAALFIEKSTWWYYHPRGSPARAPSHARHIYGSDGDWMIDFGANTFLVARAINRCARAIKQFLDNIEEGKQRSKSELIKDMRLRVSGAVATQRGYEYNGFYPVKGNDMIFGVTSIDVADFVNLALQLAEFGALDFVAD